MTNGRQYRRILAGRQTFSFTLLKLTVDKMISRRLIYRWTNKEEEADQEEEEEDGGDDHGGWRVRVCLREHRLKADKSRPTAETTALGQVRTRLVWVCVVVEKGKEAGQGKCRLQKWEWKKRMSIKVKGNVDWKREDANEWYGKI